MLRPRRPSPPSPDDRARPTARLGCVALALALGFAACDGSREASALDLAAKVGDAAPIVARLELEPAGLRVGPRGAELRVQGVGALELRADARALGTVGADAFHFDPVALGFSDGARVRLQGVRGAMRTEVLELTVDLRGPLVVGTTPSESLVGPLETFAITLADEAGLDLDATAIEVLSSGRPLISGLDFTRRDGADGVALDFRALDSGPLEVRVRAADRLGNFAPWATLRVVIDRLAPPLRVSAPVEGQAVGAVMRLEVVPHAEIAALDFSVSDARGRRVSGRSEGAVRFVDEVDLGGLDEGSASLEVGVSDLVGNVSRLTRGLLIDRSAPQIDGVEPARASWIGLPTRVTVTARDGGAGLDRFEALAEDGGVLASGPFVAGVAEAPLDQLPDRLVVLDLAGNRASLRPEWRVDTVAPTVRLTPAPTAADRGTPRGELTRLALALEDAGCGLDLRSTLATLVVTRDGHPTPIAVAEGAAELEVALEDPRSGIWRVALVAYDRCGNARPFEALYQVDAEAPELRLGALPAFAQTRLTVSTEAYDLDGLAQVRARGVAASGEDTGWVALGLADPSHPNAWSGTLPLDALDDGVVSIEVEAVDRAGNRSLATDAVIVDRTPPELTATLGNGSGWVTPACELGVLGSDRFGLAEVAVWDADGTPLASQRWSGETASAALPIAVASEGTDVRLAVRARDRAGNTRSAEVNAAVDHAPPLATPAFAYKVLSELSQFPLISWELEDAESGPDLAASEVVVLHDGAVVDPTRFDRLLSGTRLGIAPREVSGGRWRFELAPQDRVGSVGAVSPIAVDVDLEAPRVVLTGVTADGWSSGGSAFVDVATDDDTGVVEVRFALRDSDGNGLSGVESDRADPAAEASRNTWRHVFDLAPLGDGVLDLSVEAVDRAGRSAAVSGRLAVDNLPPSLAVSPPAGLQPGRFTLHVEARDEGAGVASIAVYDGAPPGPFAPDSAGRVGWVALDGAAHFAGGVEVSLAGSGRAHLVVVATDRVGRETFVGVDAEVDAVPPSATFAPGPGAVLAAAGEEPRLLITLADDRSGVDLAGTTATVRVLSQGAPLDPVSARVAPDGERVAITFARDLQLSAVVELSARDVVGNLGPMQRASFTVDSRGPRLSSTSPASGAAGIGPLEPWSALFDEAIAPSSRVVVVGREGVVAGSVAVSGASLVFSPQAPYPSADQLTVHFEVADVAGNPGAIAPKTFRASSFAFVDVAKTVGLSGYRGGTSEPGENHGPGGLFADLDEDGYPDLILAVPANNALKVYRNVASASTPMGRDLVPTPLAGAVTRGGTGVVAGDVDNDGDLDLFVTYWNLPDVMYANRLAETGSLSFEDVTASTVAAPTPGQTQAGVAKGMDGANALLLSMTAAFADVDRDGLLDLYVGTHNGHWNAPQVGALPGQRNTLFRNLGDGTFKDITVEANAVGWQANEDGVTQTDYQRHSSTNAVIFADLDNDRWPDLIVTNKTRHPTNRDMLYRNLGRDAAGVWRGFEVINWDLFPAWGATNPLSMGIDAADVDNDGDVDLYITDWATFGSVPGPNELWLNRFAQTGQVGFDLAPHCTGAYSWGARFEDFDNDGYLDLHVASNIGEYDLLYMARRGSAAAPLWAEMAAAAGVRQRQNSRGSMTADLDRDGWMDLFVVNLDDAPRLYWNRWRAFDAGARHWLAVKLVGDPTAPGPYRSTRDAIGAKVTVVADVDGDGVPEALTRWVTSGSSSATSTSSLELEFGLGVAEVVDVVVAWPSGRDTSQLGVGVDQRLVLSEGDAD